VAGARRRESFADQRARRAEVDDPALVLEAALRFLEPRPRSVSEVRRRLTGAGYREELVTAAIERLGELGMLDDQAFAALWVESRDRARPRGERALRQELHQKGIDGETIARTLAGRDRGLDDMGDAADAGSPSADQTAARRLLARHAAALARIPDPRTRHQRAYALLARNGFSPEIAGEMSRGSHEDLDTGG
jgi:regulatory protein